MKTLFISIVLLLSILEQSVTQTPSSTNSTSLTANSTSSQASNSTLSSTSSPNATLNSSSSIIIPTYNANGPWVTVDTAKIASQQPGFKLILTTTLRTIANSQGIGLKFRQVNSVRVQYLPSGTLIQTIEFTFQFKNTQEKSTTFMVISQKQNGIWYTANVSTVNTAQH